jgi:hypothetical protein
MKQRASSFGFSKTYNPAPKSQKKGEQMIEM